MTVYELIEELKLYPMDMEVFVPDSKKYDENKVYIKSLMDFVVGCIPEENRQILVLVW